MCVCVCSGWMGYVRWEPGAADGDATGGGVFVKEGGETTET